MTLRILVAYHWAPVEARAAIVRGGLKPTTPTAVWVRPWAPGHHVGHYRDVDPDTESLRCVCLGTTPSTAWCYSAAFARRGETFDLWEVELAEDDEVHYRPTFGGGLDELRVANRIPRARIWWAGQRVAGHRKVRSFPPVTPPA